ncbi:MAG: NAD-dependent epimerase [Elusimicrobia bacterium RIFCSPLOWO2_01_FULL_59_12]|nr:MAG: NAD-dependent epimerase [Elusimicrobia bacterium RIFCSPLOWO2_01_FULL_59_12]
MKAIVFGGSGFVGSHVADALLTAGHEVTIFDLRPSRYLQDKQKFIQGDILDYEAVQKAVAGQQVLYNFAGLADLNEASARPADTVRLNILGCVHLLQAARSAQVKRFVFASSIYVYSESGGFYRASKQACELYVEEFQRRYSLDYTILRYGTLYGRRADETNSVHRYLRQALLERKISASGTGDEVREYVHVSDAARVSVEILEDEFKNQNVIITGHHPMKYGDFLSMIREMVGRDVKIDFTTAQENAFAHYTLTPYTFHPKIGKKLLSRSYLDMGQGLLDCLEEIHESKSTSNS